MRLCLLLLLAANVLFAAHGLASRLVSKSAIANTKIAGVVSPTKKELVPCPPTYWSDKAAVLPATSIFSDAKSFSLPTPEPRVASFLKTVAYPGASNGSKNLSHGDDSNRDATITGNEECEWIRTNADSIVADVHDHGAVILKGFALPTTRSGFRAFCEALSPRLQMCEDALASIGVRSLLSPGDGVYEAVDAAEMSDTFIGLHNDCTRSLAPPYAAFGCLRPARAGGEFLLADGREILRRLDPAAMRKLCERGVRVRVAGLPTPFLAIRSGGAGGESAKKRREDGAAPVAACSVVRNWTCRLLESLVGWGVRTKFPDLSLDVSFSNDRSVLQILEPLKSPLNAHPIDGQWTFFSGIHSQSAYLQQKRAGAGADGRSDASFVENTGNTDVFYGEIDGNIRELEAIEPRVLDHIAETFQKHTIEYLMAPGDVVILDSYQVLHGRKAFRGPREHAVVWLAHDGSDASEGVSS